MSGKGGGLGLRVRQECAKGREATSRDNRDTRDTRDGWDAKWDGGGRVSGRGQRLKTPGAIPPRLAAGRLRSFRGSQAWC